MYQLKSTPPYGHPSKGGEYETKKIRKKLQKQYASVLKKELL
jgi:hypothetical protein